MKTFLYTFLSIFLILGIITSAYILNSNSLIEKDKAGVDTHITGHVDLVDCNTLKGWAWNPGTPDAPVRINIYFNDYMNKSVPDMKLVADKDRKDIAALLTNDSGKHGFELTIPSTLKDSKAHLIYTYAVDLFDDSKYSMLPGSPSTIVCSNP